MIRPMTQSCDNCNKQNFCDYQSVVTGKWCTQWTEIYKETKTTDGTYLKYIPGDGVCIWERVEPGIYHIPCEKLKYERVNIHRYRFCPYCSKRLEKVDVSGKGRVKK